jgi:hypothetical protein
MLGVDEPGVEGWANLDYCLEVVGSALEERTHAMTSLAEHRPLW